MKVIYSPRQSGKTTHAIKASAKTGATIVTKNQIMAEAVEDQANQLGHDIPKPISISQYLNMKSRPPENIIIDELELVLANLIDSRIELVTVTQEDEVKQIHQTMTEPILKLNKSLEPYELKREVLQKLNRIALELMEVEDKFNAYQSAEIKIAVRNIYEHWVGNQYLAEDESGGFK